MENPYNAQILTSTLTVTDQEAEVTLGNTSEYECFLFDNQGDKSVVIKLNAAEITLISGSAIQIAQDDIKTVKMTCASGETTNIFYVIQGYKKLGQ